MELRQLEYFVAVAEEGSFTRAAERVHISQSGVSAQIRALERELGAVLFDRSARRARLTPAGAAALGCARSSLAAAAELRDSVGAVTGLLRGHLGLGMVSGCTITPFFDALAAFRVDHPGVELSLTEDGSERLIESVHAGERDLALVGTAGPPPRLEMLTIVSEGLIAAVPADHRLSRCAQISLGELADEPLICMPEGTGIRTVFESACATAGIKPQVALQASAPAAALDLARRGLGLAILSESMLVAPAAGLHPVRLRDVENPALLGLVWRPRANPALARLVAHCRQAFARRA